MCFVSKVVNLWSPRSKLVVYNETQPCGHNNAENDKVPDIRAGGDDHVGRGELEAQAVVDYAQDNGATPYPSVNVGETAFATCSLEMPMLEDAHDRLQDDDGADDEQTDNDVGWHWVLEVAQIMAKSDSKCHPSDHHDKTNDLDWDVYCRNLLLQISISQVRDTLDRQVD